MDSALRHLNDPMDRNKKPIEVMLHAIEEVQYFLPSHPEPDQELQDNALIQFALIKLMKTGMYSKLIESLNVKDMFYRDSWSKFHRHCIAEYIKLLDK